LIEILFSLKYTKGEEGKNMENKGTFTKILAIAGTVLAWLPLLAPVLFTLARLASNRILRFDYLMPAELFPLALVGGGLLVWAAWQARSCRRLISWSVGAAILLLFSGQALAVASGLASGAIEATGFWFGVVLASIILYTLALLAAAIGGILLLQDLYGTSRLPVENM
jgi:hypothetical protein